MARKGEPSVTRLVVSFLRAYSGMTQAELARASRVDQGSISQYEAGLKAPSEGSLRRMAEAAGVSWPVVSHLRRFYTVVLAAARRSLSEPDVLPIETAILEPVLLALSPHLMDRPSPRSRADRPEETFRDAEEIWAAFERLPLPRRRRLVELAPWLPSALAQRVCEESVRAAAHRVEDAQELAELAVAIAAKAPAEEGVRLRMLGFCWAHVANARRVANDFAGADRAFQRAWDLWGAGKSGKPGLFPEWRLLDLEASLRREQHRFSEALDLLNRAREAIGDDPSAAGRVILNKEHVYHQMGDPQGALAALAEAAPFVEAAGDPHLFFTLRFNMAANLCHLGTFSEAESLLLEVRGLAARNAKDLDLVRVLWLESRVAAGQGRKDEAIAGLEQVQREFTARRLPYDAARSSLELAELWLEAGRTREVRELAVAMTWIFQANGIGREALAALRIFTDAAQREVATAELARRAISELQVARRQALL